MNRERIEQEARSLLTEIYKHRATLLPGREPHPLELLEPALFAQVLGIEYIEVPNLANQVFSYRGRNFRVAGLLDRQANKIAVSDEFNYKVMRFTAAHEISHWMLHPDEVIHRDKPLDGSQTNDVRPPKEREADYGAANLLMPAKLVRTGMEELFQANGGVLVFHASNAYQINPVNADRLLAAGQDTLERELAVARCRTFGNRAFSASLAETFRVSDMAMALRLKELRLVSWP